MNRRQFLKAGLTAALSAAAFQLVISPKVYAGSSQFELNQPFNSQDVFYGTISGPYNSINIIDYQMLIEATPEYNEIKKKKIDLGTGNYWILLSQASDRVIREIREYAETNKLECIVKRVSVVDSTFKEVPDACKNIPLDQLISNLDITNAIIKANKKD